MTQDQQQPKKEQEQDALKKVNLDDYAGDETDNRLAREQANRYTEDLDRAKNQQSGNAGQQAAE